MTIHYSWCCPLCGYDISMGTSGPGATDEGFKDQHRKHSERCNITADQSEQLWTNALLGDTANLAESLVERQKARKGPAS